MTSTAHPITLGIEMSNPSANASGHAPTHSIAFWDERGHLIGSSALPESSRGSDAILHAIASLARECAVVPNSIACVIVSVGPGGYTALRIATTSAKVLADTLNAKLVAVPTSRVASCSIEDPQRPALIALASKKDRCHASLLKADGSIEELGIIDASALGSHAIKSVVADHHLPKSFRERASSLNLDVHPLRLDARALLDASERIDPIDPLHCAPIYAREPDAVTQWRARTSG